jgi:membrane dipeptidase
MKTFISIAISIIFVATSCQTIEQKAAKIHKSVLTLDSHCDTPLQLVDDFDLGTEHDARKGEGRYDIPRMEKGGLDASFFAVFIGQGPRDSAGLAYAVSKADQIFEAIGQSV